MSSAWDYGPGNVDDFSLGNFLSSFTTAATQSATAINSVRGSIASVKAPLTTDTRTDPPAPPSKGLPWYVWVIGAAIVYKVVK